MLWLNESIPSDEDKTSIYDTVELHEPPFRKDRTIIPLCVFPSEFVFHGGHGNVLVPEVNNRVTSQESNGVRFRTIAANDGEQCFLAQSGMISV
jgi:hypothetical protein